MKFFGLIASSFLFSCACSLSSAHAEDCFSKQNIDPSISQNIVQIFLEIKAEESNPDKRDRISIGTGSIVRDKNGDSLILTARHVVSPRGMKVKHIAVLLSDGRYVGEAQIVEKTESGYHYDSSGHKFHDNDLALIKLSSYANNMESAFNAIPGIALASGQPRGIMRGRFSDPSGIEPGASGSPVLNRNNEIVGVLTRSTNDIQGIVDVTKDIDASNMKWDKTKSTFHVENVKVSFSAENLAWMDSVIDKNITSHFDINFQKTDFDDYVTIPGFPQNVCVVYHGHAIVD